MAGSLFESGDRIGGMTQDDLSSFIQQQITNPMWSALKNSIGQRMLTPNPPPQVSGQVPVWDGNQWVAQTISTASIADGSITTSKIVTGAVTLQSWYSASTSNTTIPNTAISFATAVDMQNCAPTAPATGTYLVIGQWDFAGTATGWTNAFGSISVNGVQKASVTFHDTGAATQEASQTTFTVASATVGQTIKLVGFKNAAAGTLVTGQNTTGITLILLQGP